MPDAASSRPVRRRAAPAAIAVRALAVLGLAAPIAGPVAVAAPAAEGPAAASGGPVPVVVAVDTSRSLSPAELGAAVEALRSALAALPAETPCGLLAFDDSPRWVRPLGARPSAIGADLETLEPAGSFTLLHDALFAAARELPDGGVVLVATDGRDENSATTLDDLARRFEDQEVRILTVGVGGRIGERQLRRLALLTDGAYLGAVGSSSGPQLAAAVEEARSGVAAARTAAAATAPRAAPAPDGGADAGGSAPGEVERGTAAGAEEGGPGSSLLLRLLAAALAVAVLGGLALWALGRRRRERTVAAAETAETEAEIAAAVAREPERELPPGLADTLSGREVMTAESAEEVTLDTAVVAPGAGTLEQTRVLAERAVLLIKEPGDGPARTFLLRPDRAFAVGRDPGHNTLVLPDPTLSSQHFKIVPDEGHFYLLDLRSTNGTYVNGERSQIRELTTGDVIHAGQLECNFRSFAHAVS